MYYKEIDGADIPVETLVIGYGNTLRTDDGAGPAVVEKLTALLPRRTSQKVKLIACGQLTPELAVDIAPCKRIIFIDASLALPAGHISVTPIHEEPCEMRLGHYTTPGTVLAMAQSALGACPHAWLAAIGCQSMEINDQLTPTVAAAVDRLARHLHHGLCLWSNGKLFRPELLPDSEPAGTQKQQG